jgi:hypothetical protein
VTTAQGPSAGQDRADYLREICDLLWPAPARTTLTAARQPAGGGRADSEMIVLPRIAAPRLVVPRERRASAVAVRRYGEPGSLRSRLATRALSAALATGAGAILLRDRLQVRAPAGAQTIETYLSSVLGQRVMVSIHLGAARANRKPVLQLLGSAGDTIGFAKIGVSPLTAELVRAERAALEQLSQAGLSSLAVPPVLDSGRWQDLEVLVLGALPVWHKRVPLRPGQLEAAMAEVARAAGVRRSALGASEYWQRLASRLDDAGHGGEQDALRAALAKFGASAGSTVLGFGSCHGDWTPWNMANTRGGLLVWDWERFTVGAPVGFDALHYWLQARTVDHKRDPEQTAIDCVGQAPALLAPLGVTRAEATPTVLAYLADLAVRYLSDRQEQAGARLGAPRRWLIPALLAGLDGL